MKILVLPAWYPNRFNSTTGDFVQYQARLLYRAGVEVSILYNETNYRAIDAPKRRIHSELEADIPTTRISGLAMPKINHFFLSRWADTLQKAARQHIRQHGKPDIIHAHVWLGGYAAARIAEEWNIPYIVTEHAAEVLLDTIASWKTPILKKVYQQAACCTAISPAMQHILKGRYRVRTVPLIPNPIDQLIFYPQELPDTATFKWVQVGDLIPLKRPEITLSAFGILAHKYPQLRLQFVGQGRLETPLRRAIQQRGWQSKVRLLGQLPPVEVAAVIRQSHALVHASEVETFGLVLAEAACCGRTVLAVQSAGASFIVQAPIGYRVAATAEAIAEGMERVMQQRDMVITEQIAQYANDRFGSEAVIAMFIKCYERLC